LRYLPPKSICWSAFIVFILTLAAAVAMAASTPAAGAASVAPESAAPAATVAKPDKDRQICKTEALAGSRVPKKVCATKAEWDARRQDDKEQLDKMQRAATPHSGM
jgi:hypothetical protein